MYGYSNASVFRDVTEENITEVEEFVRRDLLSILEATKNPLTYEEKTVFFGIFASCPSKFSFLGERKLIIQIVNYVKSKVPNETNQNTSDEDVQNDGLNYFLPIHSPRKRRPKKRKHDSNDIIQTKFGTIFGNRMLIQSKRNKTACDMSQSNLKNMLFIGAKPVFDSIETTLEIQEFTEDLASVTIENDGANVDGSVTCILCKQTLKVFLKKSTNSCSWTLSNLKSHVVACLRRKTASRIPTEKSNEPEKSDDEFNNSDFNGNFSYANNDPITEANESIQTNHDPIEENNTSTVKLEVSMCSVSELKSDLENALYTQMTIQDLKMRNTAEKYKENTRKCSVKLNETKAMKIDICEIPGDGDCMFGVIVHQLNHVKIGSNDHKDLTKLLRKDVVKFIEMNSSYFSHQIKNRIHEHNINASDIKEAAKVFLGKLSQPGFFGGDESLKAISLKRRVNIIIMNENGPYYFAHKFNTSYERTIMMAFRGKGPNTKRNHYDSVVGITKISVPFMVGHLIDNEIKCIQNMRKNEIIDVDEEYNA